MIKNKTLILVAGAAGEIGTEFCKKIINKKIDCIGIIRNKQLDLKSSLFLQLVCNLENEREIENSFVNINFSQYKKIIFLHTIGIDKFESRGYPEIKPMTTIPQDVYNTNVNTFKYLLKYCAKRINALNLQNKNKIKFKTAIIAGEGDKYAPFVIESFCEAKYILRQYIQSYIKIYPKWVSGLSINITSTITKSALKVRPYANTKYWLTPKEVVDQSFDKLITSFLKYKEIDVIKNSPNFVDDYYENNNLLYAKWSKETGTVKS